MTDDNGESREQAPARDAWRKDFRSRLDGAAAQSLGIELTEEQEEAAPGGEKKDNE